MDAEKKTIQEAFADHLRKDKKILLVNVRQVMEGHPTLTELEAFQIMSKRVADYLCYLQTSSVTAEPDLPHQPGDQRVAEWVSTASTATASTSSLETWRTTWSKEDHQTIVQWLTSHSKCPRKADIHQAFQTEEKLKAIAEHKSMDQCVNKVKTSSRP